MNDYEKIDFSIIEDLSKVAVDLLRKHELTENEWNTYYGIVKDYAIDFANLDPPSELTAFAVLLSNDLLEIITKRKADYIE